MSDMIKNEMNTAVPQTTFTFGGRSSRQSQILLTEEMKTKAYEGLEKLSREGANKKQACVYLFELGWSDSQIAQVIRYETETTGHKTGDALKVQHVNHYRTTWMASKVNANTPSTNNGEKVTEPSPVVKAPASIAELRKS